MSWVLYDLANTIFSMGVVSLYFPILVRGHAGADKADFEWGVGEIGRASCRERVSSVV